MTTVERLISALGPPQAIHEVADRTGFLGAVARWRHEGARVDLSGTDTVQVVFNVSGGQRVELRHSAGVVCQTIRAGSIGIVSPDSSTRVAITGRADTVQIILSRNLLASAAGESSTALPLRPLLRQAGLRATAIQALVGLARHPRGRHDLSKEIIRTTARWLAGAAATPAHGLGRGGLSPTARRRVHALVEERLQADGCSPLSVDELAQAAGLSVHHFTKAFRQTEGCTPHASLVTRRLDLALSLLFRAHTRVAWVAIQTGFSSPAHFVSTFRRHLGTTPGALREAAGFSN